MFRDFNKYEVFEDGRIWSYKRNKFLKPSTNNKGGYQQVYLSDNEGNSKMYKVHKVIYESVSGEEIPEGYEINHRSEDKTDNRFCNLELMTHKENCNFGTRNERITKARSKQVGAYKNGELVMTFSSTKEAGRNGFHQGAISACCRNCFNREGNNIYKGYTWRYI